MVVVVEVVVVVVVVVSKIISYNNLLDIEALDMMRCHHIMSNASIVNNSILVG